MQNNQNDQNDQNDQHNQNDQSNQNHSEKQAIVPQKSQQTVFESGSKKYAYYPHNFIAKEGWGILAGSLAAFFIAHAFDADRLAFLILIFLLFALQFFRDPPRQLGADNDTAILSPADGRIVFIGQTLNPYTQEQNLKISVFMNVFNVHSNRIPLAGVVKKIEYHAGSFLNASLDKASEQNERNAVILETKNQQTITFVQIAGLVARRILCYVKPEQEVYAGQRYGFIRFGSRVDVYLPLNYRSNVVLGQKVSATSTVLAQLD
jgi:phosphatidylserine decarboxylase